MKSLLVLPVGGSATRMQGLPKFMLPISHNKTLIEMHCEAALKIGYNEVHIITRNTYRDLVLNYFSSKDVNVRVWSLLEETQSMSETLINGGQMIEGFDRSSVTIGLADTAFTGVSYEDVHSSLLASNQEIALSLFVPREDQKGKLGQVLLGEDSKVLDMVDKSLTCDYPYIWGIAKLPGWLMLKANREDAHIGIGIGKLVSGGTSVEGIINIGAKYFDCGTFSEYYSCLSELNEFN
jgi:2-C-methyl-D-erythritol 4-phosphate cytidylyltransferase